MPSRRCWSARSSSLALLAPIAAASQGRDDAAARAGRHRLARRSGRAARADQHTTVARAADDLASLIYTSGTTGRSKGAMITPRQPGLEHARLVRDMAHHRRRHPVARAADFPCPRAVRRAQYRRCRRARKILWLPKFDHDAGDAPAAAGDADDGRADVLYAAAVGARVRPRDLPQHAAVRVGLGAAAGRDARRVQGAHRPCHPRALRHDRDRHDHVEPLCAGRPARRYRRLCAARRIGAHRRARGQGPRAPARSA